MSTQSYRKIEVIRKEIWNSSIAIRVSCDEQDLVTIVEQPNPCYLDVPRNSYIILHIQDILEYFKTYIRPELHDKPVWLSFDSNPVKWHLPAGVIFDQLMDINSTEVLLLTVHYSNYPPSLLAYTGHTTLKSHFISSIKESESLKHNSRIINDMMKEEHNMLWNGLSKSDYDEFWATNRKFNNHETDPFKYIPVKLITHTGKIIQKLLHAVPEQESTETETPDLSPPLTIKNLLQTANLPTNELTIICQGMAVPPHTPLLTLYLSLSTPDNFLYLICKNHVKTEHGEAYTKVGGANNDEGGDQTAEGRAQAEDRGAQKVEGGTND